MKEVLEEKYQNLQSYIHKLGNAAIAFSSGVDSTFLLRVAHDVLGENVIAVTAKSSSFPARELKEAADFCESEGIRQLMVETDELKIPGFASNPPNRCYLCKRDLFHKIIAAANNEKIANVLEGSNVDDLGDYRPGLQAIRELAVKSPLQHVGLHKEEIRQLSKKLGLQTWNKPSFACLSTRFAYGETITRDKLEMIDRAEQFLLEQGLSQFRVRIHGTMARIEVPPEDIVKITQHPNRLQIVETFQKIGFTYISVDLQGYRTGSMNEIL